MGWAWGLASMLGSCFCALHKPLALLEGGAGGSVLTPLGSTAPALAEPSLDSQGLVLVGQSPTAQQSTRALPP